MLSTNRFALKEWAVVIEGLKTARQLLLLRKGGIEDEEGRFRIEHPEFFLYPTFEHQHRQFLRTEFLADFERAIAGQPPGDHLVISAYAQVADWFLAAELATLRRLTPYHIWNDTYIQIRFDYKPELPLYVLVLRTFGAPPVEIANRADYRGCKSWVELDQELPTVLARPLLNDVEFESRRREIRTLLGLPLAPNTPVQPTRSAVK